MRHGPATSATGQPMGRANWPLLALFGFLLLAGPVAGRTIILTGAQVDRLAGLDVLAPRQSLALGVAWGNARVTHEVRLLPGRVMLARWDLSAIPPKSRIAHAELLVDVTAVVGQEPRLYLWRTVADWGVGVNYEQRLLAAGKALPWTKRGAAGLGTDRAIRPTGVARLAGAGEVAFNVTEDLELWRRGAARPNGWLLSVEDPGVTVVLPSPLGAGAPNWRLRLTYEPEPTP